MPKIATVPRPKETYTSVSLGSKTPLKDIHKELKEYDNGAIVFGDGQKYERMFEKDELTCILPHPYDEEVVLLGTTYGRICAVSIPDREKIWDYYSPLDTPILEMKNMSDETIWFWQENGFARVGPMVMVALDTVIPE